MAGHLLFNSGSNVSSLAPQFKWLDNTYKMKTARQSIQRRHLWSSYYFCMVYIKKKNELTWMHAAKSMSRPSCFLIFSHWSNQFGNL